MEDINSICLFFLKFLHIFEIQHEQNFQRFRAVTQLFFQALNRDKNFKKNALRFTTVRAITKFGTLTK